MTQIPNPFESIDSRLSNIEIILLQLQTGHQKIPPERESGEFMTVPQAADMLHLSVPTIYGLIHRRELSSLKRGKRVYFKRAELLKYLEDGRRNAQDPLGHGRISSTRAYKKTERS
ncbi:MAG: helix-turn-helix domain-containing protein [Saprospiraceae bacterium]